MDIDALVENIRKVITEKTVKVDINKDDFLEDAKFKLYIEGKKAYKGHNKAIEKLIELSNEKRKILIAPTGAGKTVVILTYILETSRSCLWITPTNSLQQQLFNKYRDEIDKKLFGSFDVYFFMHRSKHCILSNTPPCEYRFYWFNSEKGERVEYFKYLDSLVPYPCRGKIKLDIHPNKLKEEIGVNISDILLTLDDEPLYSYEIDPFTGEIDINVICPYERIVKEVIDMLQIKNIIAVVNPGNYHVFNRYFSTVIVDEFDTVLDMITPKLVINKEKYKIKLTKIGELIAQIKLRIIFHKQILEKKKCLHTLSEINTRDRLIELYKINKKLEELRLAEIQLSRLEELISEGVDCLVYTDKNNIVIESFGDPFIILDKLFGNKELILVSATLPPTTSDSFLKKYKLIEFNIEFPRSAIIIAPLHNMSIRNLANLVGINPNKASTSIVLSKLEESDALQKVFKDIAYVVSEVLDYGRELLKSEKGIIHVSSTRLASAIAKFMKKEKSEKDRDVIVIEEKGRQIDYIRRFAKEVEKGWLIGPSLERGLDFTDVGIQFIVKVPYPEERTQRTKIIRKKLGKMYYRIWCDQVALAKIIQACGRNARKPWLAAFTVILDESFVHLLVRCLIYHTFLFNKKLIPKWFLDRLVYVNDNEIVYSYSRVIEKIIEDIGGLEGLEKIISNIVSDTSEIDISYVKKEIVNR